VAALVSNRVILQHQHPTSLFFHLMQHIKIHSKYITWQVSQDKMKFKIILKTDVSTAGLYTGTGGNNNGQLSIPVEK
jgi:hypothetical protein